MEENTLKILIEKQLEPHGMTYDDISNNATWFLNFNTTKKEQSAFMDWAVDYLMENNKYSRKLAETEVSWFILSWGFPIKQSEKEKV